MPIESLTITNYPPFRPATFTFSPGVTVIAGPNGVGKTRLLASLGFAPSDGAISVQGVDVKNRRRDGLPPPDSHDIEIGTQPYVKATSLYPGTYKRQGTNGIRPFFGTTLTEIAGFEDWILNAKYHVEHSAPAKSLLPYQNALPRILKAFSLLDESVEFSRFDSQFRVRLSTPVGEVLLGDMSTGYQAAYSFLFAILRASTDRESKIAARGPSHDDDFNPNDNCILIDEIDRHLHPSWQERIIGLLKDFLPEQQLIVTTHSPHIIQGLHADELIALGRDEKNLTVQRKIHPAPGRFGFRGWTVEEILRDVLGMDDSISAERKDTEDAFNDALDREDVEAARPYYEDLMAMLHPANPLRRIYDHQYRAAGGTPQGQQST
ncbi:hypothetical protein DESA109040_05850 [Deinococcus saxicola]|uniref:AAA family ATPase n=1 Tax=Deinococcus saxicola TaxID=249406 RepID=UPI0039EE72D8